MNRLFLFFLLFQFFQNTLSAQLPKGDRTLGWQIGISENNNYDSAFAYTETACIETAHMFFTWSSLEPDTGVYDNDFMNEFLDNINIYFPWHNTKVELQIAVTNTVAKETPSELLMVDFADPLMIDRFKRALDTVFAHIPDLDLVALNIGNESSIHFGTDAAEYASFKIFLDSVAPYAKQLYQNIHGTDLKVGTTFAFDRLTDPATQVLCESVNASRDIISVTYYPLNSDFTMEAPTVVSADFADLIAIYSDTLKPIHFVECGYSSSAVCNSSEALQADFYSNVFEAWDAQYDHIKYLSIFQSTDWSQDLVDTLAVYYGINDPIFKEYLRALGVRTWPGNGTDKLAYDRILCELDARNWCMVNCPTTAIPELPDQKDWHFYQDPNSDLATLSFPSLHIRPEKLTVFDLHGRVVLQLQNIPSDKITFQTEDLSDGLYLFQLIGDERIISSGRFILY